MGIPPRLDFTRNSYALSHAYVPEHIPALMVSISKASPFLIEDFLGFTKDNWVILVGYPLETSFDSAKCDDLLARILARYHPEYLWFIGPEIPPSLSKRCRERQSDRYYRLDLTQGTVKPSLERKANQTAKILTVESDHTFSQEHQSLVDELIRRESLPPMISELYRSMPEYIANSETALVLNARTAQNVLTAFFVVECGAEKFDTYVLGCHSKKHYVPHASDLLFAEMISGARHRGKAEINLGLGVNAGIRRFKTKWGGLPYLNYEFCESYYGPHEAISVLWELPW